MQSGKLKTSVLITCCLLLTHPAVTPYAQSQESNYIEKNKNTLLLFCYGPDNSNGSRYGRSDIIISPNGSYRAYTESLALHDPALQGDCKNISRLYFSDSPAGKFSIVYENKPTLRPMGNGIRAIDWSPAGRYLALEWQVFYYGSEYDSNNIIVFDSKDHSFLKLNLPALVRKTTETSCAIAIEALGFATETTVAFRLHEFIEYDEQGCDPKQSLWLFELLQEKITAAPANLEIPRYGTIQKFGPPK